MLFQGIKTNGSLQTLRLDKNNFSGTQFIEAVPLLVGPFTPLHNVTLNECNLGDQGGEATIRALCKNQSMKMISLQKNLLGVLMHMRLL